MLYYFFVQSEASIQKCFHMAWLTLVERGTKNFINFVQFRIAVIRIRKLFLFQYLGNNIKIHMDLRRPNIFCRFRVTGLWYGNTKSVYYFSLNMATKNMAKVTFGWPIFSNIRIPIFLIGTRVHLHLSPVVYQCLPGFPNDEIRYYRPPFFTLLARNFKYSIVFLLKQQWSHTNRYHIYYQ